MDMFGMNGYMPDQIGMMQDPMYMNPMQNQMYMNPMQNQMYIDPMQNQMYMNPMQNQMYIDPMQNQMYMNQMGNMQRVTHKAALDMLRCYIIQNYKCYIQKEKKIEETPQELRHSCLQTGVTKLPIQYYNIMDAGIQIPYYFCNYCGTLYIFKDFM